MDFSISATSPAPNTKRLVRHQKIRDIYPIEQEAFMDHASKTNALNLDNFWMPFTANRQFKATPRLLAQADGMYYTDVDGNKVLDGTAGLWCCNAGHGRKKIAQAVERQLTTMDFAPTFQMGHPIAFDFATKLAEHAPGGASAKLDRVFFTGSGSESVDTALKIAIA
jgi:beta-alanine--pyruvate transaminase